MANTQTYTGDGSTTTFYFTFPFFGANDIKISIDDIAVASNKYTMTPNPTPDDADTQYTGGSITFVTAPASGTTIKIWRNIELARHIDYQPTLQPQSYQLNQDLNQCMEILKGQNTSISNVLSLEYIPNLAELLAELAAINEHIGDFLTADDLPNLTDLNNTVDGHTTAINTLNGYDYVIESQTPTADNNYTWYRKYKSGWVEMGGQKVTNGGNATAVTLPVTMADTNYDIFIQGQTSTDGHDNATWQVMPVSTNTSPQTTTGFYAQASITGYNLTFFWRVSGFAASNS